MSVHFFVANIETISNESTINIEREVQESEIDEIFSTFDFLSHIRTLKEAYNIALRNANEFLGFMKNKNLMRIYSERKDAEYLITNANRLVYNFSVSVKTFIGYAEIAVRKKNKETFESFKKLLSQFFDGNLEYRFFEKFRNYVVHYGFPYTKMITAYPDSIELICEKQHLLEYDGWGKFVREDIEKMGDQINIPELIEKETILITAIQIFTYGYYVENFKEANNAIGNFCRKYKLNSPVVVKINGDDVVNAKKQLLPFPIEDIVKGIDVLKSHPNIDVRMTDK